MFGDATPSQPRSHAHTLVVNACNDEETGHSKIKGTQGIVLDAAASGSPANSELFDRFKLRLTFDAFSLTWEVIFSDHGGNTPPDFIFDDVFFRPSLSKVQALMQWAPKDEFVFIAVLEQLVDCFLSYQYETVKTHPYEIIRYEHATTVQDVVFCKRFKIQSSALPIPTGAVQSTACRPVQFVIPLLGIHEKIPSCPLQIALQKHPPILRVRYTPGRNGISDVSHPDFQPVEAVPSLSLKPTLERRLMGFNLPLWGEREAHFLTNYVQVCYSALLLHAESVAGQFVARRQYIASFLSHFGTALLEYDVQNFSRISFLMEVDGFSATVHIQFHAKPLPDNPPVITLESIYDTNASGAPVAAVYENYPHSPRWDTEELADRARIFLQEQIKTFKADHR